MAAEEQKIRVLVVEDTNQLAQLIVQALKKSGLQAEIVSSTEAAEERIYGGAFDAMILDRGLPDRDGLELLREVRAAGIDLPTLVLTARITLADRVEGLDSGADDYLTKPFAMEEMLARLRALLRRPVTMVADHLTMGNIVLDGTNRDVSIAGRPAALTAKEQILLEHLMRRRGGVVTKSFLEDSIYGAEGERAGNTLEVLVHRLRARLCKHGANVSIKTIRGVGYMLTQAEPKPPG